MVKINNELDSDQVNSEELSDIVSGFNDSSAKFGTILICGFLFIIFTMTYFIKFPDTIPGQFFLKSDFPLGKLVAPKSGYIDSVMNENGAMVVSGEILSVLRNDVSLSTIDSLSTFLDSVFLNLDNEYFFKEIGLRSMHFNLGQNQEYFNGLYYQINAYKSFLKDYYFSEKIEYLKSQIAINTSYKSVLDTNVVLASRKLDNIGGQYNVNQALYESGAISKFDYMILENEYYAGKRDFNSAYLQSIESDLNILNFSNQIVQLKSEREVTIREFKNNILQPILLLRSFITSWRKSNIIESPIKGELSMLKDIFKDSYVTSGEEIFAIIPPEESFYGQVILNSSGSGKIFVGQSVHISFDSYPDNEFGVVKGVVERISKIQNNGNYVLIVKLDKSIVTNFGLSIDVQPEMTGQAFVITKDRRLYERILGKLSDLFSKNN